MSQAHNDDLDLDIAIIGMSGRFPVQIILMNSGRIYRRE